MIINLRLISIESQPKKVCFVIVVVVVCVVSFVSAALGLAVAIVGSRNLTLNFGKNWVGNC